jgi:hypothetical protein
MVINRFIKSRSLENLSGLAVWNCVPLVVPLLKDIKGLGFSIADYQVFFKNIFINFILGSFTS